MFDSEWVTYGAFYFCPTAASQYSHDEVGTAYGILGRLCISKSQPGQYDLQKE
jgi:hypothetical protein